MMHIAQQLILQKLKQITIEEILTYSQRYNISISKAEASIIVKELRRNKENPFDQDGRRRMFKKLASITSQETAQSVNRLLMKLAKEYGVEHWLN